MGFFMRTYILFTPNALLKQVFQPWIMLFYECMYVERQLHNKHVLETHTFLPALQAKAIDLISNHLLYSCYNLNPVKRKYFQFWYIIPLCNLPIFLLKPQNTTKHLICLSANILLVRSVIGVLSWMVTGESAKNQN